MRKAGKGRRTHWGEYYANVNIYFTFGFDFALILAAGAHDTVWFCNRKRWICCRKGRFRACAKKGDRVFAVADKKVIPL
jgi:hypothetical protein